MRSTKPQKPAFAEAASRRQANNQIMSKISITKIPKRWKSPGYWSLMIGDYLEFGIGLLGFDEYDGRRKHGLFEEPIMCERSIS
jgi:hypothetical protein